MNEADSVVYVVDDDSSVREAITSLIKSVGLPVETFETAQQFMVEGPQLRCEKRLHDRSGPELPHMVRFAATRFRQGFGRMAWKFRWHVRRGALDLAGAGTGGPGPSVPRGKGSLTFEGADEA